METLYLEKNLELKRNLAELEKQLKVTIKVTGRRAVIEGEAIDEYEASRVLEAIGLGFTAKQALSLKDDDMVLVRIPIKKVSRRKDLETVRARVIGTEGKTKRTIEHISGCEIVIADQEVGIIGPGEEIEEAKTAVTNLIRGTKSSNTYRFLERMNTERKGFDPNLGLKPVKKEKEDN